MKYFILIPSILISILIISCSKDNVTQYNSGEEKTGGVFFKIDKEKAPSDVVEVIAYLNRENYDTLTASLDLINEESAEIIFQDIPVGEWHLTVKAFNESRVVVYQGQTDLEVLDGITIQVNLVLNPTGHGTGNIYIHVTWGTENKWIDFPGNPVFTKENTPLNPVYVGQSKVLYENGTYKMWFTNLSYAGKANIGYVESANGLSWTSGYSSPVLEPGSSGSWDDYSVTTCPVLKDDADYKMYYSGWRDQYDMWHIGLASSLDGIDWTKIEEPILYANSGEFQIGPGDILKKDNLYYMFYYVRNYPNYSINLAMSEDGLNWSRYEKNPILIAHEP
ncbi:MAG: hypothetical protein ACM34O_11090, partial [Ignavibacteria bacterium]